MSQFNSGSVPGMSLQYEPEETRVSWSGRHGQDLTATRPVTVAAASVDAGNDPQTMLRAGLLMAVKASDGKAYPYSPTASDGRQFAIGVLERPLQMLNEQGTAVDRFAQVIVQGLVKENRIIGLDDRAKSQLSARFTFDRSVVSGAPIAPVAPGTSRHSIDTEVTAAQNGMLFIATSTVTFMLPEKRNGLSFRFYQTSDSFMRVSGSADLVVKGNATATHVTCNTAGERVGSHLGVECVYTTTGALKWLVTNHGGTTVVIA